MANHIKNTLTADFECKGAAESFLEKVKGRECAFSFQAYIPMPETLLIPDPCVNELIYAAVQRYGFKLNLYPEDIQKAVKHCFWPFKQEQHVTNRDVCMAYEIALKCRMYLPNEPENSHPGDARNNVLNNDFVKSRAEFDAVGAYTLQNVRKYGFTGWYDWRLANWGCKWEPWDVKIEHSSDKKLRIEFTTADSTPTHGLMTLSKLFPTVQFDVQYADEDIGYNCGRAIYRNGEVTEEDIYFGGNDAVTFACRLWGYDLDEYRKQFHEDKS